MRYGFTPATGTACARSAFSPARHVVADLHSRDWHGDLQGDWDVVINLVSSAGGGLDGYRLSYIEGNRSIREWAGTRQVDRFVYSSATSVYPQTDGNWVNEEDVPAIDNLSPNGAILRQAECDILDSGVFNESLILRLAPIRLCGYLEAPGRKSGKG